MLHTGTARGPPHCTQCQTQISVPSQPSSTGIKPTLLSTGNGTSEVRCVPPLTRSIQSEHMRDTIIPSHLTWTHLAPQFELQVIEMQKEKAKKRPKVRRLDA